MEMWSAPLVDGVLINIHIYTGKIRMKGIERRWDEPPVQPKCRIMSSTRAVDFLSFFCPCCWERGEWNVWSCWDGNDHIRIAFSVWKIMTLMGLFVINLTNLLGLSGNQANSRGGRRISPFTFLQCSAIPHARWANFVVGFFNFTFPPSFLSFSCNCS